MGRSFIFYGRAQALLADRRSAGTDLDSVHALLLIARYCQGTQRSDKTWEAHGRAIRGVVQLGLHSEDAMQDDDAIMMEVRRRMWWQCVLMDRVLSMTFGRPLAIDESSHSQRLPSPGALRECGTQDVAGTAFLLTVKLYELVACTLQQLYGNNVAKNVGQSHATAHISDLEHRLESCRTETPGELLRKPWQDGDTGQANLADHGKLSDRLSVEALQIVGRGARATDKVVRVLRKLIKVASHVERSVDGRSNEAESGTAEPSALDPELFGSWSIDDLDLFADLGGLDASLSSLMAA
jgi:hypothetical protein